MTYNKGDKVEWDWGQGTATGKILSVHQESITKTIDGSEITRNGSEDNPALYIDTDDANNVLKLSSEIQKKS